MLLKLITLITSDSATIKLLQAEGLVNAKKRGDSELILD